MKRDVGELPQARRQGGRYENAGDGVSSIDPANLSKIGKSHAQFQQSIQLTSSDKSVFLKHGEITD